MIDQGRTAEIYDGRVDTATALRLTFEGLIRCWPFCLSVNSYGRLCGKPLSDPARYGVAYPLCGYHFRHIKELAVADVRRALYEEMEAQTEAHLNQQLDWHLERRAFALSLDAYHAAKHKQRSEGRVYFVRGQDTGNIKIGKTVQLRKRLKALSREFGPVDLLVDLNGYTEAEQRMHERFADLHVGREWFRPEPPLTRFVDRAVALKAMTALEEVRI